MASTGPVSPSPPGARAARGGSALRSRTARRTTETLAASSGGRRLTSAWRSRSQTTITPAARSASRRSPMASSRASRLQQRPQPEAVDLGAQREVERQAVDQVDEERRVAEVVEVDGQADELQDAQVRLGRQLAEAAAQVRLVEEAALERQVAEQHPRHAGEERGGPARPVELDPVGRVRPAAAAAPGPAPA